MNMLTLWNKATDCSDEGETRAVRTLAVLFACAMVAMCLVMLTLQHIPETYKDWIIESVAGRCTNKSGELNAFWVMLFAGIAAIAIVLHAPTRGGGGISTE